MIARTVVLLALTLHISLGLHAATLTVNGSGSADYTTIQAAVNAASSGDTISVAPGTYAPFSFGGKAIVVESAAGAATTTIDASGQSTSAVIFGTGSSMQTKFRGFTVKGGAGSVYNPSYPGLRAGGGCFLLNGDGVIEDCRFVSVTAGCGYGGGIWSSRGLVAIRRCSFDSMGVQHYAGAIYVSPDVATGTVAGEATGTIALIEDCTVRNCSSYNIGGIHLRLSLIDNSANIAGRLLVRRCDFSGNSASIHARDILIEGFGGVDLSAVARAEDCVFYSAGTVLQTGYYDSAGGGSTEVDGCVLAASGATLSQTAGRLSVSNSWFCDGSISVTGSWVDLGGNSATCPSFSDCDGDGVSDFYQVVLGRIADSDGDGTPDCNDACPNDATKIAQSTYYLDGDTDGYGLASSTQSACSPPTGYVANNTDCNDSNASVNPGATEVCNGIDDNCAGGIDNGLTFSNYYGDSDGDGAGDPAVAQNACAQPTGYVSNNTDGCPANAGKQAPGVCGCATLDTDANSSGTADCADVTLAMTPLSTHIGPSGTLTVRVSMGASAIYSISGAGLSVAFDATKLQFVSATPVAGGPFSSGSVVSSDNTAGTLRYTLSLGSGQTATQSAANLVDLAFSPISGVEACGAAGLVSFGTVSSVGTSLSYSVGGSQSPVVSNLGAIYLDQTPPVITNAFADTALAADAGTIAGAAVTAPTVTAFDACANDSRPVSLSIALAGGGTVTSWPARFPVGVSTITWSSTDQAGNTATDVHTVTVANHQLLDLSVAFSGVMQGTSTRQIRVTVGGQASLHTVNLTGNSGSVLGVQVPVAASHACMAIKCPTHSLTDAVSPTVSGSRYAAVVALPQGDNNDDDMVEIFDYAIFVSVRGPGRATNAVANYNADTLIGNADFSYIALNFFASGETCTPGADGPQPRGRVSVKDLRRAGYGHLAVADLNRDGWVDLRDIQMYMQGAGMRGTLGEGQIESPAGGTSNGW